MNRILQLLWKGNIFSVNMDFSLDLWIQKSWNIVHEYFYRFVYFINICILCFFCVSFLELKSAWQHLTFIYEEEQHEHSIEFVCIPWVEE